MISLTTKLGFVAFIIGFASAQPSLHHPKWLNFKSTHGKTYNNEYEEIERHSVFFTNLKKIEEHNALFEKGLKTYSMRMNQFGDFTHKEFAESVKGLARRDLSAEHHQTQNDLLSSSPLPDSVDWRKKGAVTPVKNQGECGCCWAFSATGALEGQLFIHNGTLVSLSAQNLVDCSGTEGNKACWGGWPDWAFNYVSKAGINTEESYPYQADNATCRFNKETAILSGVKSVMVPQNEMALMSAVANIGPISVSIEMKHESIIFYGTGLYYEPECSTDNLGHAVLVVGYGTENGVDYWTMKNSWDTTWGEEGYFRMVRNKENHCGVASHATYPIIA